MIDKITSNPLFKNTGKILDKGCKKLGTAICRTDGGKVDKFIKAYEPTGANNSFLGLLTLMTTMVIVPRVKTAATRNPDNKEATRDEIVEILFRDIQTVLIILFALKASDALIGRLASRAKGLPMTTKPFQSLFETSEKGLKGIKEKGKELIKHPIKKLKIAGKNVLDALNPVGGVRKYTNKEFVDNYSGFTSIESVKKMYNSIGENKGNPNKIFNEVMDDIIENQKNLIKEQEIISNSGIKTDLKEANKVLEALKETRIKGLESLDDKDLNENVKALIIDFHKDPKNKLVSNGIKLGAITRTLALAVEVMYLGFGLPALNQKRLEKKYLSEDSKLDIKEKRIKPNKNLQNILTKTNIKENEQQIYKQFIK